MALPHGVVQLTSRVSYPRTTPSSWVSLDLVSSLSS